MKLEVGMYVRTKSEIAKIVADSSYWVNIDKFKKDGITLRMLRKKDILKASNNIIDLIEVGDYVNGFSVIHKENDILKCGLLVQFKENEIKSIVTKEQFESIKYSLEG